MRTLCGPNTISMGIKPIDHDKEEGVDQCEQGVWTFSDDNNESVADEHDDDDDESIDDDDDDSDCDSDDDDDSCCSDSTDATESSYVENGHRPSATLAKAGIILPQHLQSKEATVALAAMNQHYESQGTNPEDVLAMSKKKLVGNPLPQQTPDRKQQLHSAAATVSSTGSISSSSSSTSTSNMRPVLPLAPSIAAAAAAVGLGGQMRSRGSTLALAAMAQQRLQERRAIAAMLATTTGAQNQTMSRNSFSASVGNLAGIPSSVYSSLSASSANVQAFAGTKRYRRVESDCAFMSKFSHNNNNHGPNKKFKRSESEHFSSMSSSQQKSEENSKNKKNEGEKKDKKPSVKPEEHLRALMKAQGMDFATFGVEHDTFLPNTKKQTEDYPEAAQAARNEDFETLQKLHSQGKNLQSANIFGESIIHIVCRRGNFNLYEFLTKEAEVSIRVRDDIGRTPLHDAAWTAKPNFELVEKILSQEPDLLFARDNRGSSPLAYVPPCCWSLWCKFLDDKPELIEQAVKSEKTTRIK